ncbi:type IV pilus modification protein PilV [Herbaspirillum robiniae]|uniref:Type IV pilus modification protein PilV n=1 Tax=Herbaspirillum robiniae TaxID=2014887 RepID=A0ABX2M5B9_9BURK|nr:type IV pilus modification protein PilV [Herbaspirillum robiniae]NUU04555.1 type IV pilus modification protein PilV [Herbaspirillum robiniae]
MSSRCSGFTMIEVLVAMLVIGTGALAVVMLQLHAIRSARDNAMQAAATTMAAELAELRAAGRDVASGGDDPYLFTFDATRGAAVVTAPDCAASACDARGFAAANVAQWSARLARELPGARAVICRDSRPADQPDWQCDASPLSPVVAKLGWKRASDAQAPAPAPARPLMTLPVGR